jgi:hypothetical protein
MAAKNQEEIENDTQAGGDGSDLTDALSGGEDTGFVSAEEKKPVNRTSMLLFGVLMVGLGGYYFMYANSGPAVAAAATAEAQQADQTISQFLSAGEENIRVMRQLRLTTDKVVAQFRNSEVAQVPLSDLHANPFKYAQVSDDATAAVAAAKKREEERQAVLKSVQNLQLQSILHGAKPTCMVNNQMYTEGQTVGGFTIEKISPGAVNVRSGEYRFQLKMQR